jgi:hypothetical protein
MRHIRRILLTLLACWVTVVQAQPFRHEMSRQSVHLTPFEKSLDRHIERFDTSGRTLIASVVDLAYEYQLPMAVEYVNRDVITRPLNLQFRNQSVRQILESIIRQAPKFRVSFSQGLVDIFTPEGRDDPLNQFNKVIRDFEVTKLDTRQAGFELFCSLNRQTDSSRVCGGSLAIGQWSSLKITLHLQNAKVYEILNAIVAQNGKAIWTLLVRPDELSKLQSGDIWYVYPLQQPFKSVVLERLARLER